VGSAPTRGQQQQHSGLASKARFGTCPTITTFTAAPKATSARSLSRAAVFGNDKRPRATRTTHNSSRSMVMMAASYGDMDIVVAGGTGFVGKRLVRKLLSDGNRVTLLTRSPTVTNALFPTASKCLAFDAAVPRGSVPAEVQDAVSHADAVINLTGAPIADGRWTPERKKELTATRVNSTTILRSAIEHASSENNAPAVFVNASAIGFYGVSESESAFTEDSAAGDDFLAGLCVEWEKAASTAATRVVMIRTGIVLGKDGGALGKMLPLFAIGLGGPLGDGKQWVSWIHEDDEVGIIIEAVKNESLKGAVNAVAPNAVRFGELAAALGRAMSRPSLIPAPAFALKVLLGEQATLVLDGQRVEPKRATEAQYAFQFPDLDSALRNIVS